MSSEKKSDSRAAKELNETLDRLDAEIQKNPDDIGLYRIKVALLMEAQMFDESLEQMDKILKLDPKDTKTWEDKGEILCKMERYKEALECYNKAVELDSDLTKAWLGRGISLMKLRTHELEDNLEILDKERRVHLEDAMDSLTVVTDRNPNSLIAWNGKGDVLYTLHRYDEAIVCYNKCIRINNDFIKGWFGKGKVLKKLKKYEEAKQSFLSAVNCIKNDSIIKDIETLLCKARSFVELDREDEAIDCINTFLARDPLNHLALACKGDILEKIGRKAEAFQCYKKSVEMNPQRVYVWHRIANIKNENGEFEAAIEYYNEAVQIIPGFEEAWYKIGQILSNENKNEQAKECFSWVLEINPDNVRAKKAISTFEGHHGLIDSFINGEKRKSKGRKSRMLRKKRKKRKRKAKEYEYTEVPSQELLYQEEVYYEDTQASPEGETQYEEQIPSEEIYTEDSQIIYEEEVSQEPEYDEDKLFPVSDEVYGEYEDYKETEDQEREYKKIPTSEGEELEIPRDVPQVEDLFTKETELNEEAKDQFLDEPGETGIESDMQLMENRMEPISDSSDESDEVINELQELADFSDTYSETPEVELSDNEIDNEIQSIESDMQKDPDSLDDSDTNINELEGLLDEGPHEEAVSEGNEIKATNDPPENELMAEVESQEKELESYGDLGDNLNELEQLLIEKSDYLQNAEKKEQAEEETEEETISEELPQGENQGKEDTSSDDKVPGLEDLESNLNDLQDLMVSDSAHLDGQTIGKKLSSENKLDGQRIQTQPDSQQLDAYSSDYAKQSELKASLDNLVNQGKIHMQLREFQQAMNCFDMALKLDPQCLEAWGAKGDLLLEMDKEEEE
jgi:tetratricopeptide (TPR) repeat protein